MWYEILPSFFIITAALGLPGWGLYHIHNLTIGNHYRRNLNDRWNRYLYQRDLRITGNPYKIAGLESIKDEPLGLVATSTTRTCISIVGALGCDMNVLLIEQVALQWDTTGL